MTLVKSAANSSAETSTTRTPGRLAIGLGALARRSPPGLEHRARGRQVEGGQGVDSIVGARPHGEISGESVAEKPTHGLRT